jgi:hypothetical protein
LNWGDTSLRIIDDQGELIAAVPRRSHGEISWFKAYRTRQQPRWTHDAGPSQRQRRSLALRAAGTPR